MEAGNIRTEATIRMDYIDYASLSLDSQNQKMIVIRPHQAGISSRLEGNYTLPRIAGSAEEIDCVCSQKETKHIFRGLFDKFGITPTLLLLDPCMLTTECLSSLIMTWNKQATVAQKIALGIFVPDGKTEQKEETYFLWRANISGPIYEESLEEPVWYPSLSRDSKSLVQASKKLNPYDIFPLIEFPEIAIQTGEKLLADQYTLLESNRTRTRHFIYLDISYPDQAFEQLHKTIKALPAFTSSVFQPVVTPGGTNSGFLTALLSGVLADSFFLTPKEEVPITSNKMLQGIMILRKCI